MTVSINNYIQAADMLSTDLSHIHNWSQNWAIKFNPNKTESILFTRRNINNPPVYFGDMDNRVTDVNTHCHLGLDIQRCIIGKEFDITIKIINNIVYVYKEQEKAQHRPLGNPSINSLPPR
jgi:hypothetical protein